MRRLCVYFIEYSLYRPGYLAVCVHVQCDICAIHIVAVHSICSICVWLVARIIRCLSFIHKQLTRCGHGALNRAESLCTTHALTLLAQWPQPDRSTLMHAAHFLFYFFLLQRETCKYFVYSIHTHTHREASRHKCTVSSTAVCVAVISRRAVWRKELNSSTWTASISHNHLICNPSAQIDRTQSNKFMDYTHPPPANQSCSPTKSPKVSNAISLRYCHSHAEIKLHIA